MILSWTTQHDGGCQMVISFYLDSYVDEKETTY